MVNMKDYREALDTISALVEEHQSLQTAYDELKRQARDDTALPEIQTTVNRPVFLRSDEEVTWVSETGISRHGYNAAFMFAQAGRYRVNAGGETGYIIDVSPDTREYIRPTSEAELRRAVTVPNARILLPPGRTKLRSPLVVEQPVTIEGQYDGSSVLVAEGRNSHIVVRGGASLHVRRVCFDSHFPEDSDKDGPQAIELVHAYDVSLVNCTALRVGSFVSANFGARVERLLVENCSSPNVDGLRNYFVGLFGTSYEVAIYDNRVENSVHEHVVRLSGDRKETSGTFFAAVQDNVFSNLDRRSEGFRHDTAKGTVVLQKGGKGVVTDNVLEGAAGAGPLGGRDGLVDTWARWDGAYWAGNKITGHWQADHGLLNCVFEQNTVIGTAASPLIFQVKGGGGSDYDHRSVSGLEVRGNAFRPYFNAGKAIQVWRSDDVVLSGNSLAPGKVEYPHGGIPFLDFPEGLPPGFKSFSNEWTCPAPGWPAGKHVALVGDQNFESSYFTLDEWNGLPGIDDWAV
jgi:hypothetical protein